MTAKRWGIIDEEFISYNGGTAQLISNGECKIHLWERPQDAQLFCDKLNALNDKNEQLNQFKKQVFQIIDDSIKIYEDTTTNDEFLQIQLDTKLQTLYNLRKELLK